MPDFPRLIEFAFPLKQASLDSVHEKNVRHGHISTLHIWPARRPLAACRAALIATLLPDPGDPEKRRELCEKIAGTVEKEIEKKKKPDGSIVEREKEVTKGGILHWGRETENAETLEWFRQEIRKAYGGRAPKVLDPFAGGGAIPLEAMRLGCEATAIDINPVAWFVLKCTLEYPQKLAGQTRPLPVFILRDAQFMEAFFKAQGLKGARLRRALEKIGHADDAPTLTGLEIQGASLDAALAWHVRAWGRWVLDRARRDLAQFYPTYADFEPIRKNLRPFETQPMRLVPLKKDGTPDNETLNAEFSEEYLASETNPRWVAKPTVAYLWARSVTCKNCRATIPLLKTRWLCKTGNRRVLLTMQPSTDRSGVVFGIAENVPIEGGNATQRKAYEKKLGAGTMSRSGASCPCCPTIMTMEDIKLEGQAGRLSTLHTAVAVDGCNGKEFRLPTQAERDVSTRAEKLGEEVFQSIPFGVPTERIREDAKRNTWCVQYGIDQFAKLFTKRQLSALASIVKHVREIQEQARSEGYPNLWVEGISAYLACTISRFADFFNCGTQWKLDRATINHLFSRWALPLSWDFAEGNAIGNLPGSFDICLRKVAAGLETFTHWSFPEGPGETQRTSSVNATFGSDFDVILTDPPYYNAIGYSVLMDYFHVWLRRTLEGLAPEIDIAFADPVGPQWDNEKNDGELIDDASRHGGDADRSKAVYEDGMFRVFQRCHSALRPEGRLVIVFAHKHPDAWETLVSAIIRAGFVVDGSWPIQTEQPSRMRGIASAALASSVWMVCKKRDAAARAGWDKDVIEQMRTNIRVTLNEFWDAGIRGPDFVWAATGPALEAYSQHPAVLKANQQKERMSVSEFLTHVRRLVVDYVVGQVLSGDRARAQEISATDRLDEVTAYYLLHRHDFGFKDAPAGACILYAVSCGLSDSELVNTWDLLATTGADATDEDDDEPGEETAEDGEAEEEEESGGKVKLKTWTQRRAKSLGYEAPAGKPVPLIDRIHRLMHLWRAGDVHKVDEYLDEHGMRRHELFKRLLQSLIELSEAGGDERALLESLSNHLGIKGAVKDDKQLALPSSE